MGSCVSLSAAPALPTVATAKIVLEDGSMAQFATPITARDALGSDAASSSSFLCSCDELRFDAPARALAAEEELQPGCLYFALPVSMLRRPLSGQDMAALAVKATSAFAAVAMNRKGREAARVAPLVGAEEGEREGRWNHHVYGKYGTRMTAISRPAVVQRLSAISEASA
ncbi:uncharacterized protein LOC124651720 [Lolium rigidum]|uniref:uncharacterized protein LOC124651720 n=1 Tax=Lolium rigidum TaxID=89674 RepID=UPI001F5E33FA|nr:uncharacterized protein LOC124651720 [Lolium rigidum]XP_051188502.1 uncharacterized protein LOC127302144 [Lolium perenne]XP_051188503.1 uncharacterized protein LOC127302145 [Lolium perenne]